MWCECMCVYIGGYVYVYAYPWTHAYTVYECVYVCIYICVHAYYMNIYAMWVPICLYRGCQLNGKCSQPRYINYKILNLYGSREGKNIFWFFPLVNCTFFAFILFCLTISLTRSNVSKMTTDKQKLKRMGNIG